MYFVRISAVHTLRDSRREEEITRELLTPQIIKFYTIRQKIKDQL
jgi:hypothetical protein